jgi:hypothetical protein
MRPPAPPRPIPALRAGRGTGATQAVNILDQHGKATVGQGEGEDIRPPALSDAAINGHPVIWQEMG